MKNILSMILSGIFLVSCSMTKNIVLPNGSSGLVIDCTYTQWAECFVVAGDACPKGYKIYERSLGEFTETKIPLSDMEQAKSDTEQTKSTEAKFQRLPEASVPLYPQLQERPDPKYLIISCSE